MPTAKDIVNAGLGKIAAARVNNLVPPVTVLETLAAAGYPRWKRFILQKRRWVFATHKARLSPSASNIDVGDDKNYQFSVPGDMVRPLRDNSSDWVQRGQFLYSGQATFVLEYIRNPPDSELTDEAFNDVLSSWIAVELAEPATQNPGKRRDALVIFKDSLNEAARLNAFTLDPDLTDNDDSDFDWVSARFGYA